MPSDCSVAVAPWYELEVRHLKVTKTSVPPVYQGVLTVEVTNEGPHPVALQPGECIGLLVPDGERSFMKRGDQGHLKPITDDLMLALPTCPNGCGSEPRV